MSRIRALAGWLPAVVLVPTLMVVGARFSESETDAPMDRVQPLGLGTTWVYDVFDHGEPSGSRVRQVVGPGQLLVDGGVREVVRLSSSYDDYPGRGRLTNQVYVGIHGKDLLQYGLVQGGETLDVEPPAPAYRLPAEVGTSFEYDGVLGSQPLVFDTEVTDSGPVEVAGHTFEDCVEWTSTIDVAGEPEGDLEVLTEWTCPGIGVVRSSDTYEAGNVAITEELRLFRSPDDTWSAPGSESSAILAAAEAAPGSTEGFDSGRTYAVPDGSLGRELAWSEASDGSSRLSRVSDGQLTVTGETDGLVTARDVVSGAQRWRVKLPPPIVATPAIAGDVVLVPDGSKNLWALSAADGSARWVHRFADVVSATPAVAGDLAVVGVEDTSVSALRLGDGGEEWSASLAGRLKTAPAVAGATVLTGDTTGTLTAFELDSGEESWSVGLEGGLEQGPAVAGERVIAVDGEGVLTAYDVADGEVLWQAKGDGFPDTALTAGPDAVITVGDSDDVDAFSMADGSELWSADVDGGADLPAVIVGDEVVAVGDTGTVSVLDMANGKVVDEWRLPRPLPSTRFTVRVPPARVGDALVIVGETISGIFSSLAFAWPVRAGDQDGTGVSYSAKTRQFPLPLAVPPVVDGDDMYAADYSGTVYRSSGSGEPSPLVEGVQPVVGLAAGQGVVVVPKGAEVWGIDGTSGERLWALPATDAYVESLPAIAGDTAYVPLHEAGLVAVDLRSGQPRWLTPLGNATGTTTPLPLPGGDVAYAANGLARFDGTTGEEVWRLGGAHAAAVALSRLAEHDGMVFALLVRADPDAATGERTSLVAVAAGTGRLLWQRDLEGAPFGMGPVARDGAVVAIDGNRTVWAMDATTGETLWSFQLDSNPAGLPVVQNQMLTVSERGRPEDIGDRDFRLVTLDLRSGAFLGSYEPPSGNYVTLPTLGSTPDGAVLVPTTDEAAQLVVTLEAQRD